MRDQPGRSGADDSPTAPLRLFEESRGSMRKHVMLQCLGGSLIFALLFFTVIEKANAMGKVCVFSAVQGVVLSQNQPVAGAVINRKFIWTWGKETGVDEAVTDANGEFRLPAIFRSSLLGSFLPHQPFIEQTLLILHQGKEYKAWMFDKMNYEENGELQGKPISLVCRLENEPSRKGEIYGICDIR